MLTDGVGDPVADGGHLVKFIVYNASVAGADLWNSGFQNVTTTNGLFSYELGSMVGLPDDFFTDSSRYLGITVGGDAEISPRTRFETSGYSYHALRADSAGYATTANNANSLDGLNSTDFVEIAGDVMSGPLGFDNGSFPMNYVYQDGFDNPVRMIAGHTPLYPYYGIAYVDTTDEITMGGYYGPRMTVH